MDTTQQGTTHQQVLSTDGMAAAGGEPRAYQPGGVQAAIWARVSTDTQHEANQVPDLEKFCAHHGYTIARRYLLSDVSAWNGAHRETLEAAMNDAWRGEFKVIVVWALDRITREGAEGALRILRQFRERGCTVLSVQESWLNGSPEVQDILVAFAGWVGNQESARRSERIKAGLARRRAEGKQVGGRKPGQKDKRRSQARSDAQAAAWARRKAEARKSGHTERTS